MSGSGIYGGLTVQERREQRRARLLAAGFALVGQGGWSALSVRGVCAEAQLTARYFYESFAGREALALELFDDLAATAAAGVLAAIDAAPDNALDMARAAIGAYAEMLEGEPSHAVILFGHVDGVPELGARRLELTRHFARLVQARGRDFYGLGAVAEMETSATMLAGGMAQTLLEWTSGTLSCTREQLVEECAVMFVAAGEAAVARARNL